MASNRELTWIDTEHVEVSTTPLRMPSEIKWQYQDGEWTAEVGAPKLQNSQSDAPKSEETDEIGASKREIRDFDDEHAEGRSTEVGKTSDSREKLEAAAQTAAGYIYGRGFTNGLADAWNDDEVDTAANQIIQLLERQAAITERELCKWWRDKETKHDERIHCISELQRQYDELTAERDRLKAMNERLQVALDAVEGCDERCLKLEAERDEWKTKCETREVAYKQADAERKRYSEQIDELENKLAATKRAIAKAGGTWTEHDDGAVAVVFAPDVDKLEADLEAAHAKNRLLKAHIGKMQNGRHGWHVKANELQEKVDELTAERDDLKEDNRRYEHDCELLWQEKRELTAQRDKLHEELRIEREAVEACDGCGKVDDLQAKLDALKRAVSDAGGMWMEEGGTVTAAFAPDVDELRAERNYWKDQVHRCVIASVEPGGYTAGVMGYPRDKDYIAPYLLVTDAIDSLKDFYADARREVAKYQEVVDNQNEVIEDLKAERDQFEDYAYRVETERDKYREKFGKAMDFAGEIGRLAE